jgi:hypothetical protein
LDEQLAIISKDNPANLRATLTSTHNDNNNDVEAEYQKPKFKRWKGSGDKKAVDMNKKHHRTH